MPQQRIFMSAIGACQNAERLRSTDRYWPFVAVARGRLEVRFGENAGRVQHYRGMHYPAEFAVRNPRLNTARAPAGSKPPLRPDQNSRVQG